MKNIIFLTTALFLLFSCKKTSDYSNDAASSIKFQFKGKSYTISGKRELISIVNENGVYAYTGSEQTSATFYPKISGVFSVISLMGNSKEFTINMGALKKDVPKGVYSYTLLGKDDISNQNIYGGVIYDAQTVVSAGISILISPGYNGINDVLTDYTDGGKEYAIVPNLSTVTVSESNSTLISGTFDITCKYGSTTQKLTGSFNYYK